MGNIHEGPIRQIALTGREERESCVQCPYYAYCPGGCPSRIITNKTETLENSLDCVLKKTAFEIVSSGSSFSL